MTTTRNPTLEKEEGARSFAVLLQQLQDGVLHADASEKLQKLNAALSVHAEQYGKASGEITVTLRLSAQRGGTVMIESGVTTKEPKTRRELTVMFLTKGSNLSRENPRQLELGVRAVPAPEARDVVSDPAVVDGGAR